MDLSRSKHEHRLNIAIPGSPQASLTRGSVQRVQREDRGKQRCYHAIFLIFFLGLLLASIACFALVIIVEGELDTTLSFFDRCILFVGKDNGYHSGAWACDFVLGADLLVMVVTFFMVALYLVFVVTGMKILSGCRVLDMVMFICLSILSCAVGIILRVGIERTCENSDSRCHDDLNFQSLLSASEYLSFGVAGVYLVFFIFKLAMVVGFCVCHDRQKPSDGHGIETTPLLNTGPNVYTSVRPLQGRTNPFQADDHV